MEVERALLAVGGDELGEPCAFKIKEGIPQAELVRFGESSHVAHIEEADLYADTVEAFLSR